MLHKQILQNTQTDSYPNLAAYNEELHVLEDFARVRVDD
jgi:hypothetical protein